MPFIRRPRAGRRVPPEGFPCPHCGADVPPRRLACPGCGASDSDGWPGTQGESVEGAESGDEDDDFDYGEFIEREFGEPFESAGSRSPDPKRLILWLVIAALLIASLSLLG